MPLYLTGEFVVNNRIVTLASFGLEFIFSDFELRISELSGVSHSQSFRCTSVSHLLC